MKVASEAKRVLLCERRESEVVASFALWSSVKPGSNRTEPVSGLFDQMPRDQERGLALVPPLASTFGPNEEGSERETAAGRPVDSGRSLAAAAGLRQALRIPVPPP